MKYLEILRRMLSQNTDDRLKNQRNFMRYDGILIKDKATKKWLKANDERMLRLMDERDALIEAMAIMKTFNNYVK